MTSNLSTDMTEAIQEGDLKTVTRIIDTYGLSWSKEWLGGYFFLIQAAWSDRTAIVRTLLSRGCRVKKRGTRNTETPLHCAINNVNLEIVNMLLDKDAEVNGKDYLGHTPLVSAIRKTKVTIPRVQLKIHRNVRPEGVDTVPEVIIKRLLEHGAIIDLKGKDGETALHAACKCKNEKVVSMILKYGGDIESSNNDGVTPLHIAAMRGSLEIVKILLDNFANVEIPDNNGKTALHLASKHNWMEIARELLNHGSNINATCNDDLTPFNYGKLEFVGRNCPQFGYSSHVSRGHRNRLLNWGEDFQDGPLRRDKLVQVLEQHIVKIQALNLPVSKQNSEMINLTSTHKRFYDSCKREIKKLNNCKIGDTNISYYDLVTKGIKELVEYARYESIVETFKSTDYRAKFPIYGDMIENNFKKGQKRQNLLDPSLKALNSLMNFTLPEVLALEVMSHLSIKDLNSLIKAGPNIDSDDSAD